MGVDRVLARADLSCECDRRRKGERVYKRSGDRGGEKVSRMKLQSQDVLLFLGMLYVTRYRSKKMVLLEMAAGAGVVCVFVKEWMGESVLTLH